MRRYSPYYSPPRRSYGGRGRSPPRRQHGGSGHGGGGSRNTGSLLVRNIPMDCRPEDLRLPFERYGPVRDVYIPKDYYSGQPRGFAFVQFVDPFDASEAQYHMNRQVFCGREITVVLALETRKRPEEMRTRPRLRGSPSGYDRRRSHHGRSRSMSRSRSPAYPSRYRETSRSYSPAPRRRSEHSSSPMRRHSDCPISPVDRLADRECESSHPRRSVSHDDAANNRSPPSNGFPKRSPYEERGGDWRASPERLSASPRGSRSRSRSADFSTRRMSP